jgi:hypothetical protein
MVKSPKGSTTTFSTEEWNKFLHHTRPLILVPDTETQRNPRRTFPALDAPVTLSQPTFDIMAKGVETFSYESGFEFIKKPAYQIFEGEMYTPELRKTFWQPLLTDKYPIYIVNPFCGIMWPGDLGGMYNLKMERVFWYWRNVQLWRVALELYLRNKCNVVWSFLPTIYDNVVHLSDGTPWVVIEPDHFTAFTDDILKINAYSCQTQTISQELPKPNTLPRLKKTSRLKRSK